LQEKVKIVEAYFAKNVFQLGKFLCVACRCRDQDFDVLEGDSSIAKPVTLRSVVLEKTRQRQSGEVHLSTCAIANSLKIAVTPRRY